MSSKRFKVNVEHHSNRVTAELKMIWKKSDDTLLKSFVFSCWTTTHPVVRSKRKQASSKSQACKRKQAQASASKID